MGKPTLLACLFFNLLLKKKKHNLNISGNLKSNPRQGNKLDFSDREIIDSAECAKYPVSNQNINLLTYPTSE